MTEQVHEISSVGQPVEDEFAGLGNYWGSNEADQVTWTLPDGKQYFVIQKMNEGARTRYQQKNKQTVAIEKGGAQSIAIDVSKDRAALIEECVVGWHMAKDRTWLPFNKSNLRNWMQTADVSLVDKLEMQIRLVNPWLQGDLSVADIDDQIETLQKMREQAIEREAGKDAS